MTDPVATVGYQGANPEDLIATLKAAGIMTLVDVRSVPWSRRPDFTKRALAATLAAAGIAYEHLPGLGNPDSGRAAAKDGRMDEVERIYHEQLDSADGQAALGHAVEKAGKGPVALLCMERDAARCHRAMAAERLAEMLGTRVRHLRVEAGPETLPLFR